MPIAFARIARYQPMLEVLIVVAQALVLLVFANRYIGKLFLWAFGTKDESKADDDYEPTVTVVIPLFNEGDSVRRTIRSVLEQDYAADKLDIIVVDDCSDDGSYLHACREAQGSSRVRVLRNPQNMGKRRSINRAVRMSKSEIIVSVDSDVIVQSDAVGLLIREFTTPDMAAVGGRVDIENKHDNWLTRMQSVKYFFTYFFTKGLEPAFKSVMCLSGCLTAYRRSVLLELEPILEARAMLGVPIKYGEDRFLTRQIIKAGYKTMMTLDAVCTTKAVNKVSGYFAQQLRWRRSNIVDYIGGFVHVWKQHPAISIHFFASCAFLLVYPTVIGHALFTGWFWELMAAHIGVCAVLALVYAVMSKRLNQKDLVAPHNILFLGLITPVTYCVLVPLAACTLDSGCWETRGHRDAPDTAPALDLTPESAAPQLALAPVIEMSRPRSVARVIQRRTRKHSARDRHRTALS